MSTHQWIHKLDTHPESPLLIKRNQYLEFARAIRELQRYALSGLKAGENITITATSANGELEITGETGLPDASGVADYKVLQAQSGAATWDWVRSH